MNSLQLSAVDDDEEDGATALMGLSFGEIFIMIKEMELRHITCMSKITKLSSKLQVSRSKVVELDSDILDSQAREAESAVKIEALTEQLCDSQKRVEESAVKHEEVESQLIESQAREEEIAVQYEVLESKIVDCQAQEKESAVKIVELNSQLRESQAREEKRAAKIHNLNSLLQDSQALHKDSAARIEELTSKLLDNGEEELKHTQVEELQSHLEESRMKERESATRIEELTIQLQNSQANERETDKKYKELHSQLEEKCAIILREREAARKHDLSKKIEKNQSAPGTPGTDELYTIAGEQEEPQTNKVDSQLMRRQLQESQDKLRKLEQENQVAKGQVLELRSQLVHTQLLASLHEDKVSELGKTQVDSKKHSDILEIKVVELTMELEESADKLRKCEKKLAATKSQLALTMAEADELQFQMDHRSTLVTDEDTEPSRRSSNFHLWNRNRTEGNDAPTILEKEPTGEEKPERSMAEPTTARRFFRFGRSTSSSVTTSKGNNSGAHISAGTVDEEAINNERSERRGNHNCEEPKGDHQAKEATSDLTIGIEPVTHKQVGLNLRTVSENNSGQARLENATDGIPTNKTDGSVSTELSSVTKSLASLALSSNFGKAFDISEGSPAEVALVSPCEDSNQTELANPSCLSQSEEVALGPPHSAFPKATWQELSDDNSSDDMSSKGERETAINRTLDQSRPNVSAVSPTDDVNRKFLPEEPTSKDQTIATAHDKLKMKQVPAITPDGSLASSSPNQSPPSLSNGKESVRSEPNSRTSLRSKFW